MGASTPVILRVATPDYGRVVIEASNGMRYETDLGSFSAVYCYPQTRAAWNEVTSPPFPRKGRQIRLSAQKMQGDDRLAQ